MFERVVESFLVEYVSEWVDGLDAEKMKIGLFGGKVEVRDLRLKQDALEKFQLPIKIKTGTLGRLTLKVPWKHLTTQSVQLRIENLVLLVVPSHQHELQELANADGAALDSYAMRLRYAKQQEIRVRELFEQHKMDEAKRASESEDSESSNGLSSPSSSAASPSSDRTASWGSRHRILQNMLDNVSVEITNIHIRYEDTTQVLLPHAFALGMTIAAIQTRTTDASGHDVFIDRSQSHTPLLHKRLEVQQLGLYCEAIAASNVAAAAIYSPLLAASAPPSPLPSSYIVQPFDSSIKMIVNQDEGTFFSIPQYQLVIDLGSILASITQMQCHALLSVANFVGTHERYLKRIHIRRRRPMMPLKRGTARHWWKYALYGVQVLYALESKRTSEDLRTSGLHLAALSTRPRCSWTLFCRLWMQRKEYVTLYKLWLQAAAKKLPLEAIIHEHMRLQQLEDELEVYVIVLFRRCARLEFELEQQRQGPTKRVTLWKSKWKSSSSSARTSSNTAVAGGNGNGTSGNGAVDPRERLLIYTRVSEQMMAGANANSRRDDEQLGPNAILCALDIAIENIHIALLAPRATNPMSSDLKQAPVPFLRLELDQLRLALFQQSASWSLSSSVGAMQLQDLRQATPVPLFSMLPPEDPKAPVSTDAAAALAPSAPSYSSSPPAQGCQGVKFVELAIESSVVRFKLDCTFQRVRYIHHMAVMTQLQTFFVLENDHELATHLKEQVGEKLAGSSAWLQQALFAGRTLPHRRPRHSSSAGSGGSSRRDDSDSASQVDSRVIECSVLLPEVGVFVITSETSPALEATLSGVHFHSENLREAFVFAVDGIALAHLDGISERIEADVANSTGVDVMQPSVSTPPTTSLLDFSSRKRSKMLRKTRFLFNGEKKHDPQRQRLAKWLMQCTAPPIFVTVRQRQLHQILRSLSAWTTSSGSTPQSEPTKPKPTSTNPGASPPRQFDPDEERLSLRIHIPQILVVLKDGGGPIELGEAASPSPSASTTIVKETPPPSMLDLVLDVHLVNVEAKFSKGAEAISVEFRTLGISKRVPAPPACDAKGNVIKLTTAQAIAQANAAVANHSRNAAMASWKDTPDEPLPAFDSSTGLFTRTLVELTNKTAWLISSLDPFVSKLHTQQIVLYWDPMWWKAFVQSFGQRSLVPAGRTPVEHCESGSVSPSLPSAAPESPIGLEIAADRWFVFARVHATASPRFAFKLFGRDLTCTYSTLSPPTVAAVNVIAAAGVHLEASCGRPGDTSSSEPTQCELLDINAPLRVSVLSAVSGTTLVHHDNANVFVAVDVAQGVVHFIYAHIPVVVMVIQQIIGLFGSSETSHDVKPYHVKLDVQLRDTTLILPAGSSHDAAHALGLQVAIPRVVVTSHMPSEDRALEQTQIALESLTMVVCEPPSNQRRLHTNAISSVDEAVQREYDQSAELQTLEIETAYVVAIDGIFVTLRSTPPTIPGDPWCQHIQVRLEPRRSSKSASGDAASAGVLELALDPTQLAVVMQVVSENFGQRELQLVPSAAALAQDSTMVTEVQVELGTVAMNMLAARTSGTPRRTAARLVVDDLQLVVQSFVSWRSQIRLVAPLVRMWHGALDDRNEAIECGRVFVDSSASAPASVDTRATPALLVTIDQPPPMPAAAGVSTPSEIHIHLDTITLLPEFIACTQRLQVFASIPEAIRPRTDESIRMGPERDECQSRSKVNLSLTTGMVHVKLLEHRATCYEGEKLPNESTAALHLALSACVVVRCGSNSNEDPTMHTQVFGRQVALRLLSQWPPPAMNNDPQTDEIAVGLDPPGSRSSSLRDPPAVDTNKPEHLYRVLCEDVGVDLDVTADATAQCQQQFSLSLTNAHVVLCPFDLALLTRLAGSMPSSSASASLPPSSTANSTDIRSLPRLALHGVLEDASLTLVQEAGEFFTPLVRVAVSSMMATVSTQSRRTSSCSSTASTDRAANEREVLLEMALHFTEDNNATATGLLEDEGLSVWSFNALLGLWEPIFEPWTFAVVARILQDVREYEPGNDQDRKKPRQTMQLEISGSPTYSLNVNIAPHLLDALGRTVELLTTLEHAGNHARATVLSCGFYLANETGTDLTYVVQDHQEKQSAHPLKPPKPYAVRAGQSVPLQLATKVQPSHPVDQTLSFVVGDHDEWHALTDVRIDQTGKYVFAILPRATSGNASPRTSSDASSTGTNVSTPSAMTLPERTPLLALFDISTVMSLRTLTVSSLVRVFNETNVAIACAVLHEDGTSTEFGMIAPHGTCGVPITLVRSIASLRLLIRPHEDDGSSANPTPSGASLQSSERKTYRWSNEILLQDKEDAMSETLAACPLVLDDYDCRCQRVFDSPQPLQESPVCRANGQYLCVRTVVEPASNASSLHYAQLHLAPPLTIENKCDSAMYVIVIVLRVVRRALMGASDRAYAHIVVSERIEPHGNLPILSTSLQERTYCAISLTKFHWSRLFLLPMVTSAASVSSSISPSQSDTKRPSFLPSRISDQHAQPQHIQCSLEDEQGRKASLCVTLPSVLASKHCASHRRVIIRPRFVIHNATALRLTYAPWHKPRNKLPSPVKSLLAISSRAMSNSNETSAATSSSTNRTACCDSPQLEAIHAKLNALQGSPTSAPMRSPRGNDTNADADYFISETNIVAIQLEGNSTHASGTTKFRLDTAVGGANSTLRIEDDATRQWHDIAVMLQQVDAFTTKATIMERYIFVNRTKHTLLCAGSAAMQPQQANKPSDSVGAGSIVLPSHASTAFHWYLRPSVPSDACVRLQIRDENAQALPVDSKRPTWSGRFSLHDVSETAFKLVDPRTGHVIVLRVEVRVEASVRVLVVVTSEDAAPYPLYRVINSCSDETVIVQQAWDAPSDGLNVGNIAISMPRAATVQQRLLPGERRCFGWDEAFFLPGLRAIALTYASDAPRSVVCFDRPGEAQRVELAASASKPKRSVYVHWYLDGMTKTIHVHDTELARDRVTGKRKQEVDPLGEGTASTAIALRLTLPRLMISLLNRSPEEVFLLTADALNILYARSPGDHDACELRLGAFQVDNQVADAIFPVVFTPMPIVAPTPQLLGRDKSGSKPSSPSAAVEAAINATSEALGSIDESSSETREQEIFFHLSVFRLQYGEGVEYLKYLSAMLSPARLQLDDNVLVTAGTLCADYFQVLQRFTRPSTARKDSTNENTPAAGTDAVSSTIPERRMYIETLELHPLKLQITFQQSQTSSSLAPMLFDDSTSSTNALLLPVVFLLLKSNLVNIDAASITLNALHIFHSFTTRSFMLSAIQQHYAFQGVLQLYALVGAADILGNPLGLVTNLGVGVKDFFYEPLAGMVKSPQDFVRGLTRGTASLVKNSVYGTFNAASKVTGSLSSGIAVLSMDREYIQARSSRNRHDVVTHLGTGLLYGTKQLGHGVLSGVTGVLTAPARGAFNHGLSGFVEGIGKGLIGVAVKPTAGLLDLAATTAAGITATATVFDRKARDTRMRLPRMLWTSDKRIRMYSNDEAKISDLLHRLPRKLLANEHYETHVFLSQHRAIVATSHRLFQLEYGVLSGNAVVSASAASASLSLPTSSPRIAWTFPLASLWGAQRTPKGVNLLIGTTRQVASHPLSQNSMTTVLIPLRDSEAATIDRLVECISALVAEQRARTPVVETLSSPLPRNSIGMVLEPVRDAQKAPGYEGYGGRVVDVFVGSTCFRAGVQVGDIIVGFGTEKLQPGDHGSALRTRLSTMRKGDELDLMVLRGGQVKTIRVHTE